ncbi:hypothetical protein M422DRAFT_265700 [Sphaerobolus stellatus SS14]|uniref:Uncharacterized protein n=1 Tax=Sphaerobolus stellatus (strain SS14) TaxID=990650 RepID=A0A0C9TQU3_SPHS4|nr:hypothetical protein M422DRAFT_265700 [Sphaerobolus stellatus SS14]
MPYSCVDYLGDVTSEGDVKRLLKRLSRLLDDLIFFNNAGIAVIGTLIEDLPLEKYQVVLIVNVVGTFLCTKEAVRQYKKQSPQGGRHIINNGSIAVHTPRPHSISYTSSKYAVTCITKSTALDGRVFDISATQIDIGSTLTTMAKPISVGAMQADGVVRPEAIMDVEHVANAVVHIAGLPNTVQVLGMNIMPIKMTFVGRGRFSLRLSTSVPYCK